MEIGHLQMQHIALPQHVELVGQVQLSEPAQFSHIYYLSISSIGVWNSENRIEIDLIKEEEILLLFSRPNSNTAILLLCKIIRKIKSKQFMEDCNRNLNSTMEGVGPAYPADALYEISERI